MTPANPSRGLIRALAAGCAVVAACASHPQQIGDPTMTPTTHGTLPIHGLQMYYEVHGPGAGVPLVLLPGGGSTIDASFGRILPVLARTRRVIAIEEQAHGRTTDRDTPVRFESSADDVDALLAQLGVASADFLGFSNGGSTALQVAIRHPARVRRLVFAGSMTKRSGAPAQFWSIFDQPRFEDMPAPLKDAFLRVNPDPQKLQRMFEHDVDRMRNFRDVPDAEVAAVAAPTLILAGDRDVSTAEHAVELTRLLPHARLAILPGGHGDYLGELLSSPTNTRYAELTAWLIEQFLDS